jgi:hypothetical protein
MYLRITQRRNQDGSTVAYYALAENAWNAAAKRSEAQIVHNFGRADQVDREALKRLVDSINRVLDQGDAVTRGAQEIPQIELDRVFELGVVLAARTLWEDLGIAAAIRRCIAEGELTAPHEAALFAMAANRLEQPGSKLACATRWLPLCHSTCYRRRNPGQLRPIARFCQMPKGSASISSIEHLISSPSGPSASSVRCSFRPRICSDLMSI